MLSGYIGRAGVGNDVKRSGVTDTNGRYQLPAGRVNCAF